MGGGAASGRQEGPHAQALVPPWASPPRGSHGHRDAPCVPPEAGWRERSWAPTDEGGDGAVLSPVCLSVYPPPVYLHTDWYFSVPAALTEPRGLGCGWGAYTQQTLTARGSEGSESQTPMLAELAAAENSLPDSDAIFCVLIWGKEKGAPGICKGHTPLVRTPSHDLITPL